MYKRKCKWCEKNLKISKKNQNKKYCNNRCLHNFYYHKKSKKEIYSYNKRKCIVCDKIFRRGPISLCVFKRQKYCSKSCYKKVWNFKRRLKRRKLKKKQYCKTCGNQLSIYQRKFCSKKCGSFLWRKQNKKKVKESKKKYYQSKRGKLNKKKHDKKYYKKVCKIINKKRSKNGLPLIGRGYKREELMKWCLNKIFINQPKFDNCFWREEKGKLIFRDGVKKDRLQLDRYYPNLNLAFEYDDESHFMEMRKKYRNTLKERKIQDRRKEEMCKEAGVILIRINYKEPIIIKHIFKKINDEICEPMAMNN